MLQRIKLSFATLALALGLALPVLALSAPAVYAENSRAAACEGIGLAGGANCGGSGAADRKVSNLLNTIVNIISTIVGIAAVIMIVVSGMKYVTSGGDSNRIASAKSTLIYAIVGLVIVALAQFLVNFVLKQV